MKKKKFFKSSDLAIVKVENLTCTKDGFALIYPSDADGFSVFSKINLDSYPSLDDFTGKSSIIMHDDIVLILRYVGRPNKIIRDPEWFAYDVYEIFFRGKVRQIFAQNLDQI